MLEIARILVRVLSDVVKGQKLRYIFHLQSAGFFIFYLSAVPEVYDESSPGLDPGGALAAALRRKGTL